MGLKSKKDFPVKNVELMLCEGNVYILLEKTCSNVIANKAERDDQQLLSVWFCSLNATRRVQRFVEEEKRNEMQPLV